MLYFRQQRQLAGYLEGSVERQQGEKGAERRGGAADKSMAEKVARLGNVERLDEDLRGASLEPGSYDAVTMILNFHDVYNGSPEAAVGLLRQMAGALKEGGFIALIDHVGAAGADNAGLHRIEPSKVRQAVEDAGLSIAAESDLLANPDDDHSKMVFAPDLRGNTDRFLFKIVPE